MVHNFAAIDIGSNTVQLLVAGYNGEKLLPLASELRTTRLGATNENGDLSRQAIELTAETIADFVQTAKNNDAEAIRIIATSAVRDAENRQELVEALANVTDVPLEILSGIDEAALSYCGAKMSLDFPPFTPVIDSGGSSTEIILEDEEGIIQAISLNMGAVRAKVNGWDKKNIYQKLSENIKNTSPLLVGVGGTITTIAGVVLGLEKYDRASIEGYALSPEQIRGLLETIMPLSIEQRCSFSPLLSKRGEIIQQGLEIWCSLCEIFKAKKIMVCGGGILDGAIYNML